MRKFAVIFLALLLTLSLIACDSNTGTASTEDISTVVETSSEETASVEDSAVGGDNDAAMPEDWFGVDDEK